MLPKICRLSDLRLTSGASKWLWIRQRSRRIGIRSDSHKSKINNRVASTDRISCCFFTSMVWKTGAMVTYDLDTLPQLIFSWNRNHCPDSFWDDDVELNILNPTKPNITSALQLAPEIM